MDTPIIINRPADGNYRLSWADNRRITAAIFGDAWHQPDSLHIRFFDKLWENHRVLHLDEGFVTTVDEWTRPVLDMLLDLIEGCWRMPLTRVIRMLNSLLGEELAFEFLPVLAKANIVFHLQSEYMSDVKPKGFLRVGPHPEAEKKAAEDAANTVTMQRDGYYLVRDYRDEPRYWAGAPGDQDAHPLGPPTSVRRSSSLVRLMPEPSVAALWIVCWSRW